VTDAHVGADQVRPLPVIDERTFAAASLDDGIRRAVAWLETAPPGRRQILVVSPFPIGSLTAADLGGIPGNIAIDFRKLPMSGPRTRTVDGGVVFTSTGVRRQRITLDGAGTSVNDTADAEDVSWPIEIRALGGVQQTLAAATAAVRFQRVWLPPPGHRARLVVLDQPGAAQGSSTVNGGSKSAAQGFSPASTDAISDAGLIRQPWMAEAVARIAADADLQAAAAAIPELPANCRRAIAAAYGLFAELSERIRATPAQSLALARVSLPTRTKVTIVLRATAGWGGGAR
jgi:hypothetical protein